MPINEKRRALRDRFRDKLCKKVPAWYSPWFHALTTIGLCVTLSIVSIFMVDDMGTAEWLTVPAGLVFLNVFEWWVHKYLMHIRVKPFQFLYHKHTVEHHRMFLWKQMGVRNAREMYFVMLPFWAVISAILFTIPLLVIIWLILGSDASWVYLFVECAYIATYEFVHMLYHLPESSRIGQSRLVRGMAEHHARHHDPKLMADWNFNILVPMADRVLNTTVSHETLEEISELREAKPK